MKSVFDVKSITNNYNYSADVPWIHTQTKIGIYEKVEKKIEGKYKPVPEKPRSFEEVKRVVKRLNTYVQQNYKVDVPTVVKYGYFQTSWAFKIIKTARSASDFHRKEEKLEG